MNGDDSNRIVVGVQGGRGSFNDSAAKRHLPHVLDDPYRVEYLFTTMAVLDALQRGTVHLGQFALVNSLGGIYDESLEALCRHRVSTRARYKLSIRHALLSHPDVVLSDIERIVTHPAVTSQCAATIRERLSHIPVEHGQGDLLDPSRVAQAIASAELPPTTATISNPEIAEEYGLNCLVRDLQDADSASEFLLVGPFPE